ncbi:hypothetical protein ABKN59_010335 [Abortiporus biennis]
MNIPPDNSLLMLPTPHIELHSLPHCYSGAGSTSSILTSQNDTAKDNIVIDQTSPHIEFVESEARPSLDRRSSITRKSVFNRPSTHESVDCAEGWAKVSKVLREYDDDVIKGYKEDMDTLLVFAGLFSAVSCIVVVTHPKKYRDSRGSTQGTSQGGRRKPIEPWVQRSMILMGRFKRMLYDEWMKIRQSPFGRRLDNYHKQYPFVDEVQVRTDASRDIPLLVETDATLVDDEFLDMAVQCVSDANLSDAISFTRSVLHNRFWEVRYRSDIKSGRLGSLVTLYRQGYSQFISTDTVDKLRRLILSSLNCHLDQLEPLDSTRLSLDTLGSSDIDDAVSFLLAFSYHTRQPDFAPVATRLLRLDYRTADQVFRNLCLHVMDHDPSLFHHIDIDSDSLRNIIFAATAAMQDCRNPLPTQLTPNSIIQHTYGTTNHTTQHHTLHTICYVVLSLINQAEDEVLVLHSEELNALQKKLVIVLETMNPLAPIIIRNRDFSYRPHELVLNLHNRVPDIVENRFKDLMLDFLEKFKARDDAPRRSMASYRTGRSTATSQMGVTTRR